MKTGLILNFSALVMLVLAVVFFAGCATTKPIDWNSRIGSYTFDQAVSELGPPDKQAKLSDGKTVAQWITHREGGTSFSVGTAVPINRFCRRTTGEKHDTQHQNHKGRKVQIEPVFMDSI